MNISLSKSKFIRYLFSFFIFSLGIVIGIAVRHYYNIPISETFNIIDVATLLTTIFIAVYVPSVLDKRMHVQQEKKNLINQRIDELQSLYRRINTLVQQDDMTIRDKVTIKSTLDILNHRLDTIGTLITYLNTEVSFTEEIRNLKSISGDYERLLLSTGIDNKDFKYPQDIQSQEETLYNKMDKVSSLMLFKLSDA